MKNKFWIITKTFLLILFLWLPTSNVFASDSDDGLFSFLPNITSLWHSITHTIFQYPRLIWNSIFGFVVLYKIYIGWSLVVIVPIVGLLILFMYLANRPKEVPVPYIQTNHPSSKPEDQFTRTILYVTHANGFRENIPMLYNRMIIGTNPGCQIVLQDDNNIADQQAEIYTLEGRYFVRDLGSGYCTYVNGSMITDITELFAGYYLQMGGSTIQL